MTKPFHYEFRAPGRIVLGCGRRRELGALARELGTRAFVVCGSRTLEQMGRLAEIRAHLETAGVASEVVARISREPRIADVDEAVAQVRARQPGPDDLVLAVGGGSALDLGKAIAGLARQAQPGTVKNYLEGVGQGWKLTGPLLPVLAVPTTGGTGSEATKNAVISVLDPPCKKSLRADGLVPRTVLIDPVLSVDLPPDVTAHTGLDALTQLIESTISTRAQPLPQALARQGIELARTALPAVYSDGSNLEARTQMAHAALLSGLSLANSGLGIAHGIAAGLGALCPVPHGLACALLLPVAWRVNLSVAGPALAEIGTLLTGRTWPNDRAAGEAGLAWLDDLLSFLKIPRRLREIGLPASQLPALVPASRGNSMDGNPVQLDDRALLALLEEIW